MRPSRRLPSGLLPVAGRLALILVSAVSLAHLAPMRASEAAVLAACPPGGIVVPTEWTAEQWQVEIEQIPGPQIWCIEDGLHSILAPVFFGKASTKVIGIDDPLVPGKPTLSGAKSIPSSSWTKLSNTRWVATVAELTVPPLVGLIPCQDGTNHCQYPDDVYYNETRPVRVWSLDQQGSGQYYVDYTTKQIYIGRNPAGARVGRAVPLPTDASWGISGMLQGERGATVQDLVVEKVGNGMQSAAISGGGWTISNVDVHFAHARGVAVTDGVVKASFINDNGQLGINAGGTGTQIVGNKVNRNGWVECYLECGGMKVATGTNVTVGTASQPNMVAQNEGPGIWMDLGTINYSIMYNTAYRNTGPGIQVEASYDGVVAHNTVLGNGIPPFRPGQINAGIELISSGGCHDSDTVTCPPISSPGISVFDNRVGSVAWANQAGITVRQQNSAPQRYGPAISKDTDLHDNNITMCQGAAVSPVRTGVADDVYDFGVYEPSRNIVWHHNAYRVSSAITKLYMWWMIDGQGQKIHNMVDWPSWQAGGNDLDSSYTPITPC